MAPPEPRQARGPLATTQGTETDPRVLRSAITTARAATSAEPAGHDGIIMRSLATAPPEPQKSSTTLVGPHMSPTTHPGPQTSPAAILEPQMRTGTPPRAANKPYSHTGTADENQYLPWAANEPYTLQDRR